MSAVTGPISSMPGSRHALPKGATCDDHPDRPAVARVQGETDSFGCEMVDMCEECVAEHEAYRQSHGGAHGEGFCQWCKAGPIRLFAKRDYDEGLSGPVYYICEPCRTKAHIRENEEAEQYYREVGEEFLYPNDDDFDDVVDSTPKPKGYGVRYYGTNHWVKNRDGSRMELVNMRDADNFVRSHHGKLRGRRILAMPIWE